MFKRSASKLSVPLISLSTAQPREAQLSTAQNLILAKKSALQRAGGWGFPLQCVYAADILG